MTQPLPIRPANLLDQRFAMPAAEESFEVKCSMMLADHGVFLSDLAPEAFVHICDHLRKEPIPELA